MDHTCTEKGQIRQNADAIASVGSSVASIEGSVRTLVDQVSRMADLFERAAISETEIKGINKDLSAVWRRIDETIAEVRNATLTDREILKTIEFLQSTMSKEIERVKTKAKEAQDMSDIAVKLVHELRDTPGRMAMKYLGYAVTVAISVLVTRYFDRIPF